MVLPEHALRGEDLAKVWIDDIDNPKTGAPIGNGPFLVQSWQRGKQLTLVRNRCYAGPHTSHLDRIVMRWTLDPDELAALFRANLAQVAVNQYSHDLIATLRSLRGVALSVRPDASGWEPLDIRQGPGGHPSLQRKVVRRALAYAIDRDAIVRALFPAAGRGARPLDSAVLRTSSAGFRPNWGTYRYRPAEARRLLEQAGCAAAATGSTSVPVSDCRSGSSPEG